MLVLPASCNL